MDDNQIFFPGFFLQHCFCQFVLALAHWHQYHIFVLPFSQVITDSVDWILSHQQKYGMHVVASLEPVHSLYFRIIEDFVQSFVSYQYFAQSAELAREQQLAQ